MSTTEINSKDLAGYRDRNEDRTSDRTVITEPKMHSWMIVAAGAVVPLGLAGTALATTYSTTNERVAMTAWIVVAIVGTASIVSSATVSHRRIVSLEREKGSFQHAARDQKPL